MERFLSVPSINFVKVTSPRESCFLSAENSRRLFARVRVGSLALIVMSLGAVGATRAEEDLPSQDQALARALVNHPNIVAAKAKIALAEAELYGKRIEVSRQVLGLYGSLRALDAKLHAGAAALSQLKALLERANQLAAKGAGDQATKQRFEAEVQAAEAQLVYASGEREHAERELRLLIGTAAQAAAETPDEAATAAIQAPQGPIVELTRIAAEKPVKLDFVDAPLQEVMRYLSEAAGVTFSLQRPVLEDEAGVDVDSPITLSTNEVRLRDALQAIEDAFPDLQFVLRDYGILLTAKAYAQKRGYAPVLELGKW